MMHLHPSMAVMLIIKLSSITKETNVPTLITKNLWIMAFQYSKLLNAHDAILPFTMSKSAPIRVSKFQTFNK